ncbi:serine/threonine-protein kinase Nek8 isoform X2 [Crotalus tigris]|uniref:serine/threonine-protein kinase Nek8 isoform X2 n=1 Tax=Crotalus tigris TaxID=88082 RepID=UPI00192F4A1E|nr:serine/threonine-protein kinase Nek8 isoform X2 [Crotalus tigris]
MEKYERIRVVGRGAFGIVHLCLRRLDQKLVILKQIPVEQMTKDERLAAQNECQVLKLLHHPHIIEYYENFLEDKALMIAMEYAPGGTLAEFIHKRGNSLLDEETILHFFAQILLALHHVHAKQILHRDLKTQNILLDKHHTMVKIGDFGISKILSSKSKAYTVVGTPCYISPELCEGKPYNQKSDIWALGCVLYELASLKRAFEAANLPALVLKIMSGTFAPISDRYSPELRQLILSLLNLDPSKRPPLNEIMAEALCVRPLLDLYTDVGSVRMRRSQKGIPCRRHRRNCESAAQRLNLDHVTTRGGCNGHKAWKRVTSRFFRWRCNFTRSLNGLPVLMEAIHLRTVAGKVVTLGKTHLATLRLKLWPVSCALGRPEKSWRAAPAVAQSRTGGAAVTARARGGRAGTPRPGLPPALSSIYTWGSGIATPLRLPMLNTEVVQVSTGRTQRAGVTKSGRLVLWEPPPFGTAGGPSLPGATEQLQPQFVCRFLEGQSGVTIKHVACGDLFTACLTDRGIVLTFGSGSSGCLGHGSFVDISQPKIVEALLGYEITQAACGASHVLALSSEGEVFTWGRGDNGRLGLGTLESHSSPQLVPLPSGYDAQEVLCGMDASMILTSKNQILACGSNRYNKLGQDRTLPHGEPPTAAEQVEEVLVFSPACSAPLSEETIVGADIGTSHSAAITASGQCYTLGSNQHGQLGPISCRASRAPYLVEGLLGTRVTRVGCGDAFTLAVGADGEVYTWGKSARGRLGRKEKEARSPRPVQLEEGPPSLVVSVSCCHGTTLLTLKPGVEESSPQ